MKKALIFLCALSLTAFAIPASANSPAYIAVGWDGDQVYFLDNGLNKLSSFTAGAIDPDGVTSDGKYIYSGHFTTSEVIAYDLSGTKQFSWGAPALSGLQGMTMVGSELAIFVRTGLLTGSIDFYNPLSGAYIRSISNQNITGSIEGLAYDGTLIWAIGDELLSIDPISGSTVNTINNAAWINQDPFGGTGIAIGGIDELILVSPNGNWYRVSKTDGSILASGKNGIDMYDLAAIPAPEPATILSLCIGLIGLAGFRKRS